MICKIYCHSPFHNVSLVIHWLPIHNLLSSYPFTILLITTKSIVSITTIGLFNSYHHQLFWRMIFVCALDLWDWFQGGDIYFHFIRWGCVLGDYLQLDGALNLFKFVIGPTTILPLPPGSFH